MALQCQGNEEILLIYLNINLSNLLRRHSNQCFLWFSLQVDVFLQSPHLKIPGKKYEHFFYVYWYILKPGWRYFLNVRKKISMFHRKHNFIFPTLKIFFVVFSNLEKKNVNRLTIKKSVFPPSSKFIKCIMMVVVHAKKWKFWN